MDVLIKHYKPREAVRLVEVKNAVVYIHHSCHMLIVDRCHYLNNHKYVTVI